MMFPTLESKQLLPYIFRIAQMLDYFWPIIYFTSFTTFLGIIVQTVQFITVFDLGFFLQYSAFYIISIYIMLITALYTVLMPIVAEQIATSQSFFALDITQNSQKAKELVNYKIKRIHIKFFAFCCFSFVKVGLNMYFWKVDSYNSILLCRMLHQQWPEVPLATKLLQLWVSAIFLVGTSISIVVPVLVICELFHVTIHLILLIDYVKCRTVIFNNKMSLGGAQESIRNHIRTVALKHKHIKRHHHDLYSSKQTIQLTYYLSGFLMGFMIIVTQFTPTANIFQTIIDFLTYFVCSFLIVDASEECETFSVQFTAALYDLNWYDWSAENQKLLLILITHSARNIPVTIRMMYKVNRELLLKIGRLLYPVANLLYSMRN